MSNITRFNSQSTPNLVRTGVVDEVKSRENPYAQTSSGGSQESSLPPEQRLTSPAKLQNKTSGLRLRKAVSMNFVRSANHSQGHDVNALQAILKNLNILNAYIDATKLRPVNRRRKLRHEVISQLSRDYGFILNKPLERIMYAVYKAKNSGGNGPADESASTYITLTVPEIRK